MNIASRAAAAAILVACFLAACSLAAGAASTPSGKYALWTGGPKLRGANVWQRRVIPELDGDEFLGSGAFGPPVTQADFDGLAARGANWVQLSCPGVYSEKPPYRLDPAALANLDALVAKAEKAGLYVTIAFRTGPGRSEFSILRDGAGDWFDRELLVESVWIDPSARAAWAAMWRATAERYRDRACVVGYDLMVEPNAQDILECWDQEEFFKKYKGTGWDWNSWHPAIAKAIREADPDTPILVQPEGYGSVDWLEWLAPPAARNVVLAVHPYDPHEYTHQSELEASKRLRVYPGRFDADYDGEADAVDSAWLDATLGAVDAAAKQLGLPVCANEFGVTRWEPGADAYLRDLVRLFERRGWNHAIWEWKLAWKPFESVNEFDFTRNAALDAVVRAAWAKNAERPE